MQQCEAATCPDVLNDRLTPALEMPQSQLEQSKGILNPRTGEQKFRLSRRSPAEDLSFFIQRYWIVRWNLRGQDSHTQETLPSPCVNMVIEHDKAGIYGVVRQTFSRLLDGQGWAFGVKFRPGAFFPVFGSPVHKLTDTSVQLRDVFGAAGPALAKALRSQNDPAEWILQVEKFLREQCPKRDEKVTLIDEIVNHIADEPEITTVDDVVRPLDVSKRTLQRLFRRYVGVGPKWVIQRYRLQEAADRLADGEDADWTQMALDLGYFDQAHFIKDFRAIIGVSPAEYARRCVNSGS